MTPTAPPKLLTAEEFGRLPDPPDGSREELVRGEVITMPPPNFGHGKIQAKVSRLLGNFIDANNLGHIVTECGVKTESDPDTVRGPDVSYWSYRRIAPDALPDVYPDVLPDLVVEVRSPGQSRRKLREKASEYLVNGASLIWIVDPEDRSVTVYRQPDEGRELGENATLGGEDVLPGFSCKVAELFA